VSDHGLPTTTEQVQGPGGVVVRLPVSEGRCVQERQARPGRCTKPFVPGFGLSHGVSTLTIGLRFLFILIHTCFRLRPPVCGNRDERKAVLSCSLLSVLWVVEIAVKVAAMGLLGFLQY
jgi:hypothetical protein